MAGERPFSEVKWRVSHRENRAWGVGEGEKHHYQSSCGSVPSQGEKVKDQEILKIPEEEEIFETFSLEGVAQTVTCEKVAL